MSNIDNDIVVDNKVIEKKNPIPPGPNRASRRATAAQERRGPFQARKFKADMERHQAKIKKLARIEAKHEENRKRSAARRKLQASK